MTLTMLTRTCPGCGAGFSVNLGSKRKYCSDPCKERSRPHRDHTATPGLVINPSNPHHHPATAKVAAPTGNRLPCVHYWALSADGHGLCQHCLTRCPHCWELDSFSHGVCQLCREEHDYSPLYKKYRGAFVKIGGRE